MTNEEMDESELRFASPINTHTRRLGDEMGLERTDFVKVGAYAKLVQYFFREGVRAALVHGEKASVNYLRTIEKRSDPLTPEDRKREPGLMKGLLADEPYSWES